MMFSPSLRPTFARACAGLCVSVIASLPPSLSALDPEKSIFQFNCQTWTRASGLPADRVSSVTQSSDGYIWIGGQNGLIRFDGAEFKSVPVTLPQAQGQNIRSLQPDADGRLWFSIAGGGFGRYEDGTFSPLGDPRWDITSGADGSVMLLASDGAVWTCSVDGWRRWVKDHPELTASDENFGPMISFWEETGGRIWLGSAERGLHYWENGTVKRFPSAELATSNIWTLARDRAGHLWVGTNRGLHHYDADDRYVEVLLPTDQISALHYDRHGVLWIATNQNGLGRYRDGQLTFLRRADGLASDQVTSLFEDAEGSLWVGTMEGLSQLTDLKFPIFSTAEGFLAGATLAVTPSHRGGLWIGAGAGFSYFDGTKPINYVDHALTPNTWVRRIFESRDGRVFLGDGDHNLDVVLNGRLLVRFHHELWQEAIAEDAESVLVGVGPDLHRLIGDQLVPYHFDGEPPALEWINNLFVARDGILWVASNNGLFRIEGGHARHWSMTDGLLSNRVHQVTEDAEGAIWIAFPTGLMRLKAGKFTSITPEAGLTDPRIYAIVPDDLGALWLMSGRGVLRVSLESLTAFAEGRSPRVDCTTYDGLESMKFTDRNEQAFSGCKTPDGRIWFPNPRGLVMIDPANHFVNRVPPRVDLDRILVNGEPRPPEQAATLASGDRRVEFFFNALSYIAPKKVRIQYQLEGFDDTWIDARQQRSATYSNLHSGNYTFRIRAANADGVWNVGDTVFAFALPPPFHQTLWFYTLCGLAISGSIWGGVRWKVQHLRRMQQKLQQENDLLEAKVGARTDELAHSLSLLKATLDSTADGILALAFSGRIVTFNTQFTTMWAIPPEKMADDSGAFMRDSLARQVKDPDAFLARIDALHHAGDTEIFDLLELKDGRIFERYIRPQRMDGKSIGIVINFRDITERRRAEAIIAESSALLESLLTHTLDIIYFKDRDSRFVRFSDTILRLYGISDRASLRGKSDFDLLPAEQASALFEEEQKIIRTGQPIVDTLQHTKTPDGTSTWAMTTKLPWRDVDGNIIGTFGVSRDVTALKEAEAGLAYERDLLRALLDTSPDQIYFKDLQSRVLKCSQAMARNFHVDSSEDLVGKTDFDFFSPEHARPAFDDEQEIIRTGRPLIGKIEKEVWLDGRETWALTSKIALRNNLGEIIGTVGTSKDITALKAAERELAQIHKQLLETSRQAGMAEVATGVLHNVGNVLNSVNVSATLIVDQVRESKTANLVKLAAMIGEHTTDLGSFLTDDPKGRRIPGYLATLAQDLCAEQKNIVDELSHLRKNIEHIKDIVAMQQSYAKVSGVVEAVPLIELAEDALRINASALVRHGLEVVRDYQAEPIVTVERHKVLQILVNLIRNAKYACDDSGRSDKRIVIRIRQEGDRVKMSVIDNGIGIPRENLTRIFAHGFTTRKEGHGFGLHSGALAAREMGGSLLADSEGVGHGAAFTLDIPLRPDSPSP